MKKTTALLLNLFISSLSLAAPINYECEINPNHPNKDCPNDPLHIDAYEMDYMNFGYAWDKSYGTARVAIMDRWLSPSLPYNSEFNQRLRRHDSGSYYRYRMSAPYINDDGPGGCKLREPGDSGTFRISDYDENTYASKGHINQHQTILDAYPNAFINEYNIDQQNPMIEIAVKNHIDVNLVDLEITSSSGSQPILNLGDSTHFTKIDGNSVLGYTFYYTESFSNISGLSVLKVKQNSITVNQLTGHLTGAAEGKSFSLNDCNHFLSGFPDLTDMPNAVGRHGDFILGLYGSVTNNNIGMSSVCRECSISFATWSSQVPYHAGESSKYYVLKNAIEQGNQIINLSGFWGNEAAPNCENQGINKDRVCALLEKMNARDVVMVASSGNTKGVHPNWPANEVDHVIGVGGTDLQGRIWDEQNDSANCPLANNKECGTQYVTGSSGNIMAPAQHILLYHGNDDYNGSLGCFDANFGAVDDGYQYCTGTSFSAPIIGGVVAIMKSLNPLLSFDEVKTTLSNNRVFSDGTTSYAIPNTSNIIKNKILGYSNGNRIANRVKPMFRLKHRQFSGGTYRNSYLSTSIPQVAMAAMSSTYMAPVSRITAEIESEDQIHYSVDSAAPLAVGYGSFAFSGSRNARAPYYIFGGHENPLTGADDMIPLYHFAYRKVNYPSCDADTDHGYATAALNEFTRNNYLKCSTTSSGKFYNEGIEGYLLPECPIVGGCYEHNANPDAPQCLRLRYSETDKSHAVYMESEQNGQFASYTTILDSSGADYRDLDHSECLGYVFPNIDSDHDLVIDGMELVLGTNPNLMDSDGDGVNDGIEYPPASTYVSDPMIAQ